MNYTILLLLLVTVLLLVLANGALATADTVFLCTTYFDCPKRDSWEMFTRGVDQILALHDPNTLARIDTWVVVNEYCSEPRKQWSTLMAQQYPFITFIQKGPQEKGQVKSLNMLLPYTKRYKYWFHWEEGWYPTRPFLNQAFRIMDTTDITQLQLTNNPHGQFDWMTRITEQKTCKEDYCIIHHSEDIDNNLGEEKIKTEQQLMRYWPLYSLQPSLNRVSFYTFGDFSSREFPPPLVSEYDFGRRWYIKGGIKGVLRDGALKRPDNYVSTH